MKVILACVLLLASSLTTRATTLDFSFSFTNILFSGGGPVTGVVRGLRDNDTSAASSVEVLTNVDGFGIGEYVNTSLIFNEFTVMDGSITMADFASGGTLNPASADVDGSLGIIANFANLSRTAGAFGAGSPVTFTRLLPVDPVAPAAVPLPAGAILALTGLGALALVRRRRPAA